MCTLCTVLEVTELLGITHLHCDLSTAWVADKELNRCTEVGIQSVLLDWSFRLTPTTLDNAVWISTCTQRGNE